MLALSVIFIILTLAVAVVAAITLRGKNGCAVRSCASGVQLSFIMTVVLIIMQMAQASVIYDNQKLNDRYVNSGIDLYYLGKAGAIIMGIALVIAAAALVLRLLEGRIKLGLSKLSAVVVTLISLVAGLIYLTKADIYSQYVDMLVPAVCAVAFGLFVFVGNLLFSTEKLILRIVLIAVNVLNSLAAVAAAVIVIVLAKGVLEGMDTDTLGAVLLTLVLAALIAPALTSTVSAVKNSLKQRRTK